LTLREGDVVAVGESRLIVSRVKNGVVRLALDVPDHVEVERIANPNGEAPPPAAEAEPNGPSWAVTARRGSRPR
jgi:hypothetical protein